MADKEVTTKLTLQGDAGGMVAAMDKAKASATSMVGHMNTQSKELTHSFEGVETILGRVGTFMVALSAGAGLKKVINEAVDWNLGAAKLGKTLGTTSGEASVLQVALHGFGIENDVAQNAALRLSLALSKGTDKFDKFGITVKDSNGQLLPMPQIMANVNQKLIDTQTGTDRNIIAMSLYGKGWKELQGILKVTPHALEEARETAERLHLIVGPKGIEQSLQYKKNLREIGLVTESLSIQIGNALLPEILNLSSSMLHGAEKSIPAFTYGLHSVEAEVIRMAMLADKAGGSITTMMYYLTGGKFTDTGKWWADQNKVYEERYKESEKSLTKLAMAEVGLDENGNPFAKQKKPTGDKLDLNTLNQSRASDRATAAQKYLDYEKAFGERKTSIVKIAADAALAANQREYDQGLSDLDTYLQTKNALTEESLYAELDAKKKALIATQAAMKVAETTQVKNKKGERDTDKENSNIYEAWKKEEEAQKALAEAESKFHLQRMKNSDEYRKSINDETLDKRASLSHWEQIYQKNKEDEEKTELDHQNGMVQMAADAAEKRLTFLGKEEEALALHHDAERQRIISQTQWKLDNVIMEESERRRLTEQTNAELVRLDQDTAQQRAQTWWSNAQQYIGFSQNMATVAGQLLIAESGQKNALGKKMLAMSIRFGAQTLQAYMMNKAKEHVLNAFAAGSKTTLEATAATANLTILGVQATAWAAFYAAQSLNPLGGAAFMPAAAAMTAVAGGVVPTALAGVITTGATSVAAESAMAAAWGVGAIAVGAAGEVAAGAIEGGASGVSSAGSSSASSSVVTQPVSSTSTGPNISVVMHFDGTTLVDEQKLTRWNEDVLLPSLRNLQTRGVTL